MKAAVLKAGAASGLIVFAIGFVLGVIRVLIVAPTTGALTAVIIEAPLMLLAAWAVTRWSVRRLAVPARAGSRLLMGGVAFGLLMMLEVAMSLLLTGASPTALLASWRSPEGTVGLLAQACFGLMPLLHLMFSRR